MERFPEAHVGVQTVGYVMDGDHEVRKGCQLVEDGRALEESDLVRAETGHLLVDGHREAKMVLVGLDVEGVLVTDLNLGYEHFVD